jgi:hypothetical protein
MSNLTPPNYCKDAVATNRGWEHPKTGELLVSVKGLLEKLGDAAPKAKAAPKKKSSGKKGSKVGAKIKKAVENAKDTVEDLKD